MPASTDAFIAGKKSFNLTLPPKELCNPSLNGVNITLIFLGFSASIIFVPLALLFVIEDIFFQDEL
jgi:hypothetical protein